MIKLMHCVFYTITENYESITFSKEYSTIKILDNCSSNINPYPCWQHILCYINRNTTANKSTQDTGTWQWWWNSENERKEVRVSEIWCSSLPFKMLDFQHEFTRTESHPSITHLLLLCWLMLVFDHTESKPVIKHHRIGNITLEMSERVAVPHPPGPSCWRWSGPADSAGSCAPPQAPRCASAARRSSPGRRRGALAGLTPGWRGCTEGAEAPATQALQEEGGEMVNTEGKEAAIQKEDWWRMPGRSRCINSGEHKEKKVRRKLEDPDLCICNNCKVIKSVAPGPRGTFQTTNCSGSDVVPSIICWPWFRWYMGGLSAVSSRGKDTS